MDKRLKPAAGPSVPATSSVLRTQPDGSARAGKWIKSRQVGGGGARRPGPIRDKEGMETEKASIVISLPAAINEKNAVYGFMETVRRWRNPATPATLLRLKAGGSNELYGLIEQAASAWTLAATHSAQEASQASSSQKSAADEERDSPIEKAEAIFADDNASRQVRGRRRRRPADDPETQQRRKKLREYGRTLSLERLFAVKN
ncbi:hypothetical protein DL766_009856 [Monosporascus sp. MC13-8B]|uniref:Uncharacterized protein n=1 Tax=Monosporascus cannonballus TaxID=155416 RepID=A0ABY0GVH3_9PEZI|nr:hypothetical protein DL762_008789 [Monosporascus cannonballus]RYO83065.1 hypothetical protein DL763_008014 [Monosporascus cannonballus]RYP13442.1 hypothetical protein DL766_009856 [Monosporascus sp. MC13-8B]